MAAPLVQPHKFCKCHAGHHQYDRRSHGLYSRPSAVIGQSVVCTTSAPSACFLQGGAAEKHKLNTAATLSAAVTGTDLQEPREYPFEGGHVQVTQAWFRKDNLPELTPQCAVDAAEGELPKAINSWALCVPIPVPENMSETVLEAVTYTIRYGSLNTGDASVQTDVVIGADLDVNGVITDYSPLPLYSYYDANNKGEYGPPVVGQTLGLELSSVPAFKQSAADGEWSHYLDHQKVYPNVRFGAQKGGRLYLFFHVYEYPDADALRSLSVDVSATWNDGEALRKLKEEKEREIRELREERDKLAVLKSEIEAQLEALKQAAAQPPAPAVPSVANAPAVADEQLQQHIGDIAKQLGKECPAGFAWNKTNEGYTCGGGGHTLTFAELGMQ